MFSAIARDIRFAVRQFRQRPAFTLTVIVVLALGLGANTAIFTVVNAFLLQPLPYPEPDRLVAVAERAKGRGGDEGMGLSPGNYLNWKAQTRTLEQWTAYTTGPGNLSSENNAFEPERILGCSCSANFTATLRVAPMLGREFRPDEDRFGASRVVILSYNLWQRRFGGGRDIIGKRIRLDSDALEVVGVMPSGFHFPNAKVEIWLPLMSFLPPPLQIRGDLHFLNTVGRLRSGVTIDSARAELDGFSSRYKHEHPEVAMGSGVIMTPLHEIMVNDIHTSLLVLLGAVACVLLIACVNVANLLLTRSSMRVRELSIRAAIGAARGEIVRQLLAESVLLGLAGGAAGLALAVWLVPILITHAPGSAPILLPVDSPMRSIVFIFSFGIALLTGIAVGLLPALQSSRADVIEGLRENTRSSTFGRSQARFRGILVGAEVALSLVLLVGAALLLHSFARLLEVKPGLRTGNALTMTFTLPNTYKDAAARSGFFANVVQRLKALPGVSSAGLGSCPPVSGDCNTLFFYREDRPFIQGKFLVARESSIDPNYLASAGIPLLQGRTFTAQDGVGFDRKNPRAGSILINESMAREFFGNENPIGKRVFFDFEVQRGKVQGLPVPKYDIIGVVGDVVASLEQRPQPTLYRPLLDGFYNGATILLHTNVPPRSIAGTALQEIHKLDPSLAIYNVRTMEDALGLASANRQFTMLLFAAFAALAVTLAAVGLYGVLSHTVMQRRAEIGIRMALGATGSDVSGYILRQGMKPAVAGVVVGLVAAFYACRILKSMLFGVVPLDPLTFIVVPPVLLLVAALASYVPARRATRIDPVVALRSE